MQRNKMVVHYRNHNIVKGVSNNFFPNKLSFNLEATTGVTAKINVEELKAVFFTKDFDGNKNRKDSYTDDIPGAGRKMKVEFFDGEVIVGYSLGYSPERQGFFLTPADADGNNERIFVVSESATNVNYV